MKCYRCFWSCGPQFADLSTEIYMRMIFVTSSADLVSDLVCCLVFGILYLVSGIWYPVFRSWYLVFVRKNHLGLTFATRQLLLPRFVSRPGHVTGWWGQVCNWDKKNSPFLLHLPRSLQKGRHRKKLKMKLHSFALLCLYLKTYNYFLLTYCTILSLSQT